MHNRLTWEMRNKIKNRNVGIELARIAAMFLVIVMHINTQGGIFDALQPLSCNYIVEWFLLCVTYCAVDLFAIISGYVGVNSGFRYSRILNLWLGVAFYTVTITVCFAVFSPGSVGLQDFVKAVTPASTGQYWFFSAYFAMFFFIPFMNYLINELDDYRLKVLGITIIIVFSIIPTLRHTDPWVKDKGYSTIWLMCLYLIGGIIRKFDLLKRKTKLFFFPMFLVSTFITCGSKVLVESITLRLIGEVLGGGFLISYLSPFVVLQAVSLLGFFANIEVSGEKAKKAICAISATTFPVFILHEHPLIKHRFIIDRFACYADKSAILMVISVLVTAIVIFGICTMIDMIKIWLFKSLHVRDKCELICNGIAICIHKKSGES